MCGYRVQVCFSFIDHPLNSFSLSLLLLPLCVSPMSNGVYNAVVIESRVVWIPVVSSAYAMILRREQLQKAGLGRPLIPRHVSLLSRD